MQAAIAVTVANPVAGRLPTIDVRERQDLWYWSRELGLSVEQLQHVVECTGPRVDDVRDFLGLVGPARTS